MQYMQYEAFLSYIQSGVQAFMGPGTNVALHKVRKNNNLCLDALTILPPGQQVSPTIYLNAFYEDYQNGTPPGSIMERILRLYEEHQPRRTISPDLLQRFDTIRTHVAYKLINYDANRPLLQTIPHIPFLDLAIVFYLLLDSSETEELTALITNEHLRLWQISRQSLYETAAYNTPDLYRCRCVSIDRLIRECTAPDPDPYFPDDTRHMVPTDRSASENPGHFRPEPPLSENNDPISMYILTNHKRLNGATCLLYQDVLEEFSSQCGGDFFVLPSSIHETILLPCPIPTPPESLQAMVQEMNAREVAPWERLSDQIYRYQADQKQLVLCHG